MFYADKSFKTLKTHHSSITEKQLESTEGEFWKIMQSFFTLVEESLVEILPLLEISANT